MKKGEHLPMYGVGPIYVYVIAAMTLAAVLMRDLPAFESGRLESAHTLLLVLGVILIEMLVFAGIFTTVLFAYFRGERKYSPASIHNYPPDIQEEYFKIHERVDVSYRSKSVLLTKSLGVLIFALIPAALVGLLVMWMR